MHKPCVIQYSNERSFYDGIAALTNRGIRFEASYECLTITCGF